MWIPDHFFQFSHYCGIWILGDLLAFLIQSPADFHGSRRNDWRRQDYESTTFWERSGQTSGSESVLIRIWILDHFWLRSYTLAKVCTLWTQPSCLCFASETTVAWFDDASGIVLLWYCLTVYNSLPNVSYPCSTIHTCSIERTNSVFFLQSLQFACDVLLFYNFIIFLCVLGSIFTSPRAEKRHRGPTADSCHDILNCTMHHFDFFKFSTYEPLQRSVVTGSWRQT